MNVDTLRLSPDLTTVGAPPAPVEQRQRVRVGRRKSPAPPPGLSLRLATVLDARPLRFFFDTALRKDYFVRRGQLEELLTDAYHEVLVAELDGVLVGVAIQTRGTCLTNVLVHPAYRGLRIGRALIAHSGACEVRAKLDMQTGDPRAFYGALGFEPTGQFNRKGNIELLRRPLHRAADSPTQRDESPVANRRHVACAREGAAPAEPCHR